MKIFAVLLFFPLSLFAQSPSDIYLLGLSVNPDFVIIQSIQNVSRNKGYDNQPWFSPDGKYLYFSSERKGVTDVYRAKPGKKKLKRITCTEEPDYSPQLTENGLTTVRIEANGEQHLRLYSANSCSENRRLLPEYDSVAYYTRFGNGKMAIMHLEDPDKLFVFNAHGQKAVEFSNPGRCLQPLKGTDSFSFVWKKSSHDWDLCALDESGSLKKITSLQPPFEDYDWMPDGRLIYPKDSVVIIARPDEINETPFSFDLSGSGIKGITRVAVSSDGKWLAVVAQDEE